MMSGQTAFVGFGSNLGDRGEFCDRAVTLMGLLPQTQCVAISSYYESEPIDPDGTLGTTWFYNGIVKLETQLSPHHLWEICRETERALGRTDEDRSGPRTLDLDILFFDQQLVHESGLIIPHPRLHLRRFVLVPLVELDPHWIHPTFNQTSEQLLLQLQDKSQIRKLDVVPGSRFGKKPACSSTQSH